MGAVKLPPSSVRTLTIALVSRFNALMPNPRQLRFPKQLWIRTGYGNKWIGFSPVTRFTAPKSFAAC